VRFDSKLEKFEREREREREGIIILIIITDRYSCVTSFSTFLNVITFLS